MGPHFLSRVKPKLGTKSKLMSSISGLFPDDIIRVTQEFLTPRYLATSAPE